MKIKFFGHAAFLLTSDRGVNIITDPYKPGCFDGGIQYGTIDEPADIVTISHEHDDHNETRINGNPVFIRGGGSHKIKGISIRGIESYHDACNGKERGRNIIFNIAVDGINIVHLGDLGHDLAAEDEKKIGKTDVLLIPIGGFFTIDAKLAERIVKTLKPKYVIPMHYKTEKCGFPIADLDNYLKGNEFLNKGNEFEVTASELSEKTEIIILNPIKK